MKSRKEIEESLEDYDNNDAWNILFELLLDIRELLQEKEAEDESKLSKIFDKL